MTVPFPYERFVVGTARVGYGYIDTWAVDVAGGLVAGDAALYSVVGADQAVSLVGGSEAAIMTAAGGDSDNG